GGKAFVRVARPQGVLTVKWGGGASASCHLNYDLGATPAADGIERLR
ncbi:FimD/PapC C-terminal domain-containing protein, partial [Pseudomonas viridiflava]